MNRRLTATILAFEASTTWSRADEDLQAGAARLPAWAAAVPSAKYSKIFQCYK
jgi:hypothetical protein